MRTRIFSVAAAFLVAFTLFARPGQAQDQPSASEAERRLGLGGYLAGAPGGVVPSVFYDTSDRTTVMGAIGLYSGMTSVSGEVLYKLNWLPTPDGKVVFVPYVSGGIVRTNVSYGFVGWSVSENFTGVVGSGGTLMTVRAYPRWRFSGGLDVVHVGGEGVPLAGVGLRLGAHYLF